MDSEKTNEDAQLLTRYVTNGDERAFTSLVNRHAQMLSATATRICGPDEAPDAVQAALITFAKKASQIRERSSVSAWLHRTVTLEAMAHRRRRLKRARQLSETMTATSHQASSSSPQLAKEIDTSLNTLSDKDREVIILHHLEGHSFQDISKQLGGTEAAWQKRCIRALKKLSQKLTQRGVTVPLLTLTTLLTASRSEAALSQPVLQNLISNALAQKGVLVGSATSPLLVIMNLKVAAIIALTAGFAISTAWSLRPSQGPQSSTLNEANSSGPLSGKTSQSKTAREAGFNLQALLTALKNYDQADEDNSSTESRLRAMIFNVPSQHLAEVKLTLDDLENSERFKKIIIAFYARWAEIDPESAWASMEESSEFKWDLRRAVLHTWIHMDPDSALDKLAGAQSKDDLAHLDAYSKLMSPLEPLRMVDLVNRLAEFWPEAAEKLYPNVALAWVQDDPRAAGDWVEEQPNRNLKNRTLQKMAVSFSRNQGSEGLLLADRIEDPKLQAKARDSALKWWGWGCSGKGLRDDNTNPSLDLKNGVPTSFAPVEIATFTQALMQNYYKESPKLLAVARNDQEREMMYRGMITGAAYSDPTYGIDAIAKVSQDFAESEKGITVLSVFINRLHEKDPQAAEDLLSQEPQSFKTQTMRTALGERR